MIGINGKTWDELKTDDIKAVLSNTGEDSIFDESVFFEWKSDAVSNVKLINEICAFANTFGGYLFLGINDDRTIGHCSNWNEQKIHTTVHDSITPMPYIDVKRFEIEGKNIYIIKVDEGNIPPYITREGKIFCRLSSGSFVVKDAVSLSQLIEKRHDTMRKIAEKIEIDPLGTVQQAIPDNLCAYIDVGFSVTQSESYDKQYERFDKIRYEDIVSCLQNVLPEYGITKVGTSLFFTIGKMTGKTFDGKHDIELDSGIQNFMEIMLDGSVKYRILLSYDRGSKINKCSITGINRFTEAFADIYMSIMGSEFSQRFISAHKYQKMTVLKQFQPYYYINEQNDPVLTQRIREIEKMHKMKYGSNSVVLGNRFPETGFVLIDRERFSKFKIPYDTEELIALLFSTVYFNVGFIDNPFDYIDNKD